MPQMGKTLASLHVLMVVFQHFKVRYYKKALKCYASMEYYDATFSPYLILSFVLRSNHLQNQISKINED